MLFDVPRIVSRSLLLGLGLVACGGEEPVGPTASFSWEPVCDLVPAAAFTADVSEAGDAPIAEVHWEFDDGTTADTMTVEHRFSAPGPHDVSVRVVDEDGLEHTHTERIDVVACLEIVSQGTEVEGSLITGVAEVRNVSGYQDALVGFVFTILDADGEPWFSDVGGGQHSIPLGETVSIGGYDWRECGTECDTAGEVVVAVDTSYWE